MNTNDLVCRDVTVDEVGKEKHRSLRYSVRTGDFLTELRQIRLGSLHAGGKESFSLSLNISLCQTLGWRPIL